MAGNKGGEGKIAGKTAGGSGYRQNRGGEEAGWRKGIVLTSGPGRSARERGEQRRSGPCGAPGPEEGVGPAACNGKRNGRGKERWAGGIGWVGMAQDPGSARLGVVKGHVFFTIQIGSFIFFSSKFKRITSLILIWLDS
jgi:hypothetical protein